MPAITEAVLERALAKAQVWRRRPYVVAVSIGMRHRGGRYRAQRGIVVTVRRKHDEDELRRRRWRPFPPHLVVRHEGRTHEVPVDVQETGGQPHGELQGLVAARCRTESGELGAVGALVRRDGQILLMTARHVVLRTGRTVNVASTAGNVAARVTWVSTPFHPRLDHALMTPLDPLAAEAARLCDATPLSRVRPVTSRLIGAAAYVRHAEDCSGRTTTVRQIRASAPFGFPGQTHTLHNLIATDAVTVAGDSGTLLYDSSLRAVGNLVGKLGMQSYFIPCDDAFDRLQVELVT